ncbi:MAG: DNA-protecting protein DprA [Betaproteobacteria bacterium]|nr:DNA-protecting protein DprA [Betaproteobacteria bacterium]
MDDQAELAAWIDLSLVPGLGGQTLRRLLTRFGLPRDVFRARRNLLEACSSAEIADRILRRDRGAGVRIALAWADSPGNGILTLADAGYPKQLFEISDPPALIYVRGNAALLSARSLAMVGSRNATPQGAANAEHFARSFSNAGITVVSGLALGIDTAAHRGGLAGIGSTIAVIGTGADIIYPKRNLSLTAEIAARGAIVSEFPIGTPPLAENFPRRNRIISGLSRGCLVVEAATMSGSLITARLAAEQGREVFAIPGSIHSPVSRGCHALIKQGAKLVESAADVLEELGPVVVSIPNTSDVDAGLLQHIGFDPCNIDDVVMRSGLTAETVSAMLLELELEGKVAALPGGLYQRQGNA